PTRRSSDLFTGVGRGETGLLRPATGNERLSRGATGKGPRHAGTVRRQIRAGDRGRDGGELRLGGAPGGIGRTSVQDRDRPGTRGGPDAGRGGSGRTG